MRLHFLAESQQTVDLMGSEIVEENPLFFEVLGYLQSRVHLDQGVDQADLIPVEQELQQSSQLLLPLSCQNVCQFCWFQLAGKRFLVVELDFPLFSQFLVHNFFKDVLVVHFVLVEELFGLVAEVGSGGIVGDEVGEHESHVFVELRVRTVNADQEFPLYGEQVHWSSNLHPIVRQILGEGVDWLSEKTAKVAVFDLLAQFEALLEGGRE